MTLLIEIWYIWSVSFYDYANSRIPKLKPRLTQHVRLYNIYLWAKAIILTKQRFAFILFALASNRVIEERIGPILQFNNPVYSSHAWILKPWI